VIGYRRELAGQRPRLVQLGVGSVLGGLTGSILLLVLPGGVFAKVVPVLIVVALVLVVAGPRLSAAVSRRRGSSAPAVSPWLLVCVFLTGVYGGYFGAAQGIILFALLSIFLADTAQRLNGAKNVLAMTVNAVASVVFVLAADVDWKVVGIIATGSVIGGQVGASVGRRLSAPVLRAVVVVVGLVAVVKLVA